MRITDLTKHLTFGTIILVEINGRSFAARTGTVIRDIAIGATPDRFNGFCITSLIIVKEIVPVPILGVRLNLWELIHFELLVFRGVGIIESPLFKRNISADKADQPAVLLVKQLNEMK